MILQGPYAPMANDYYSASGFPLDMDPAPGSGSMAPAPMTVNYPGQDDIWDMGPGGSLGYASTQAPSMSPSPYRVAGFGASYANATGSFAPVSTGPRMLEGANKKRKLTVRDIYPYSKQQHKRKLSVGTPARELHAARPKIRTLIEHTIGGGEGYEMFAHKKQARSYRQHVHDVALQRRLSEHKRKLSVMDSSDKTPHSLFHFDGSGRRLSHEADCTICAAPMPSQMMPCYGIMENSPTAIPNPDRNAGLNTQPREETTPLTFAQFSKRLMERNPPASCMALPTEEREVPLDPVTLNVDLNPYAATAHNLDTEKMGRGCIKECGCHFLAKMRDNTEALINTCRYEDEWACPCMVNKRECHSAVKRAWENRGGIDPLETAAAGGRQRRLTGGSTRARRLAARQNVRQHRLDKRNLRKLLRADVRKLKHDDDMRRQRRRSLMRRFLKEEHASKLEKFEDNFHRWGVSSCRVC